METGSQHPACTASSWVLAALFLFASFGARAQTFSPLAEWQFSAGHVLEPYFVSPLPVHERMVGLPVQWLPRYEGASRTHIGGGLVAEVRWRDVAFASTSEGFGVNLLRGKGHRAGLALTYDLGRKEHADPALAGLGDISAAPEMKAFGEYVVVFPLVVRADVRRALGGHGGWTGDVSAYMPVVGTKKFFVMLGPSLTWIDGENAQRTFGVTPAQAASSGYPVYTPGGGLSAARLGGSATWFFGERWFADISSAEEWLERDARKSPFVRERQQPIVTATVGYEW